MPQALPDLLVVTPSRTNSQMGFAPNRHTRLRPLRLEGDRHRGSMSLVACPDALINVATRIGGDTAATINDMRRLMQQHIAESIRARTRNGDGQSRTALCVNTALLIGQKCCKRFVDNARPQRYVSETCFRTGRSESSAFSGNAVNEGKFMQLLLTKPMQTPPPCVLQP
jgi:hypothetical protein